MEAVQNKIEQQARDQVNVLEDTITLRRLDQLSRIGTHFSTLLIRMMAEEGVEPMDIMRKLIDEQTLMYPKFQEELTPTEQQELIRTLSGSWEDVLFHAQVCQRLLDTNI